MSERAASTVVHEVVAGSAAGVDGPAAPGRIVLVGSPNVGKSVLFANLTGVYVTVSNYPGTTVEVSRGTGQIGGRRFEVIDTPGMYSLLPISEDERVARRVLTEQSCDAVLHVVDARSVQRMLSLTAQLMEAGLPVLLVLNMMDEAEEQGLRIDAAALERELGIPVVPTVSTTGRGMDELRSRLAAGVGRPAASPVRGRPRYGVEVEEAVGQVAGLLEGDYPVDRRALALLALQGDEDALAIIAQRDPDACGRVRQIAEQAREGAEAPVDYALALERARWGAAVGAGVITREGEPPVTVRERLGRLLMHPVAGAPVLAAVLYFGLYKLVGQFGAGTVVDFLEGTVFEQWINPPVTALVERLLPWTALSDLVVGEYGVITLGLRYAVAIILPIVTLFFLVFSVIEDVGYLPRLGMLLDRVFKKVGLSGRAVIPMVLGLGCTTMATMVTRTLTSRRERAIATLLLSLAVPCSAQLGVILALLSGRPAALLLWAGVVGAVYVGIGFVADRLFPGKGAAFYVEVPPLRWPRLGNVLRKTLARVKWYFMEVLPLFLLASVLIWFGRLTGLFGLVIRLLSWPTRWIGMPAEAAQVFLFGFFRRDYGAAGLYDLNETGALNTVQLVVGTVALTLFMPCIAQFLMTAKERGWPAALGIAGGVVAISFGVAFVVFHALTAVGFGI